MQNADCGMRNRKLIKWMIRRFLKKYLVVTLDLVQGLVSH